MNDSIPTNPAFSQFLRSKLDSSMAQEIKEKLFRASAAPEDSPNAPRWVLAGYSIDDDPLGEGGMGVVFYATDRPGRELALKFMAPSLVTNRSARKRFIEEARHVSSVHHENVVRTHGLWVVTSPGEARYMARDGQDDMNVDLWPFIEMDYVKGTSLKARLDSENRLPWKEVVIIGQQVAEALAHFHANDIIHRDIKPENILLENGIPKVKMIDFGLAKALQGKQQTWSVVGTPPYMSPEQLKGEELTAQSDQYSLGVMLHKMLTGKLPDKKSYRPPDHIPDYLKQILVRLLQEDPRDRYEDTEVLAKELRQLRAVTATPPPLPRATTRLFAVLRKHPRVAGGAATVAILAMLLSALMSIGPRLSPSRIGPPQFAITNKTQQFDRLEDAVAAAGPDDVIEARYSGVHISSPIVISGKPLTIRAGEGFRPVIRLDDKAAQEGRPLLTTDQPLVLEGLELQCESDTGWQYNQVIVECRGASLFAAHCRFLLKRKLDCVRAVDSPECRFENCEFLSNGGAAVSWQPRSQGRLSMRNCLVVAQSALHLHYRHADRKDILVELEGNTLITPEFAKTKPGDKTRGVTCKLFIALNEIPPKDQSAQDAIRFQARRNVVHSQSHVVQIADDQWRDLPGDFADSGELLAHLADWAEEGNLYSVAKTYLNGWRPSEVDPQVFTEIGLEAWNEFWGLTDAGSVEGAPHYARGDVLSLAQTAPEQLSASDFRLPGDAAAGIDPKFVGLGEPWEAWRATPQYTQWRKMIQPLLGMRGVVVIAGRDFWYDDYQVRQVLEKAGAEILVASSSLAAAMPNPDGDGDPNSTVQPDRSVEDLDHGEFDFCLLTGGPGHIEYLDEGAPSQALRRFVIEMLDQNKPVLAVGDGVRILGEHKLLEGLEATLHRDKVQELKTYGAIPRTEPDGVVRSGRIITAEHAGWSEEIVAELARAGNE